MKLSAKMESFDTFWEAPEDIEKGYGKFLKFYKRNYLRHIPKNRDINVLIISCGPGYFANLLKQEGYKNIFGIDSDPEKVSYAIQKGLPCEKQEAFSYLENCSQQYDLESWPGWRNRYRRPEKTGSPVGAAL